MSLWNVVIIGKYTDEQYTYLFGDKLKLVAAYQNKLQHDYKALDHRVGWLSFKKSQITQALDHEWAYESF